MRRKIIYILVCMLVFSTAAGAMASANMVTKPKGKVTGEMDYSHTILGEYCTATWCGFCRYAHGALKNIYAGGWHPFYYVSLVTDVNNHAMSRRNEITSTGYPTLVWDGGYRKDVGAGSVPAAQAAYNASIVACGKRAVADIDLSLDVTWLGPGNPSPEDDATNVSVKTDINWTNAEMNIDVTVDNNEGSQYNGHLHVYVTEVVSSMGWNDTGGKPYTFAFLDYAWNEDISISQGSTWTDSTDWDGKDYNNGQGDDFGGITQNNTMVIATVFDEDNDDYSDETTGIVAGVDTDPKTYDIYFGKSNPPPKVSSNQSNLSYDPGLLDFDTKYYWKIIVWDNQGASTSGPIWEFTTRGNEVPYTPGDPDPENGETDVNIDVEPSWTGGDPDDDKVTYDVYFGKSSPPPKVKSNQSKTTYKPGLLDFDSKYYWQIVAWDIFDYTSTGPIWSFTTEENLPPNEPSDPDPEDSATEVPPIMELSWTGGDPNSGDTVKYDVYCGTNNPPPLIRSNLSRTYLDPGKLESDTTYYWQIVAWDSQDVSTTGPIWHFTTISNQPPDAPSISGPTSGKPGKVYNYKFSAIDPEGDDLHYWIEWGDGEKKEWIGSYNSGEEFTLSHTWEDKGTYEIKAKAKDVKDAESDWSILEVTMPKNKAFNFNLNLLSWLFERFPHAFPMLRYLLGL
ncbi:MAG: hypothetical protein JSW60_03520 [Thermoplasmatales archaeon]|nr:MAG: hypothetical protein JSW60_03520 [Thermoplasmatales archaeon]